MMMFKQIMVLIDILNCLEIVLRKIFENWFDFAVEIDFSYIFF